MVNSATGERSEIILERVKQHVPAWSEVDLSEVAIRRLSGLSNACYRVELKQGVHVDEKECDRIYLYRKFECQIVDKQIEKAISKCMSEKGLGPRLIYSNDSYRIESFFDGRPLTIWEMRNPVMMSQFATAIHNFHTKSGVAEAVQLTRPLNTNKLYLDERISEWGPACVERIAKIRSKLTRLEERGQGQEKILRIIDDIEHTMLKPGFEEVHRALVPRDKAVMSHNDGQAYNILSSLTDATDIMLIDYEYGMWNPQYYDLAIYLNELVADNAYPGGNGIAYYLSNWAEEREIEFLTQKYFELQNPDVRWSMQSEECQ